MQPSRRQWEWRSGDATNTSIHVTIQPEDGIGPKDWCV